MDSTNTQSDEDKISEIETESDTIAYPLGNPHVTMSSPTAVAASSKPVVTPSRPLLITILEQLVVRGNIIVAGFIIFFASAYLVYGISVSAGDTSGLASLGVGFAGILLIVAIGLAILLIRYSLIITKPRKKNDHIRALIILAVVYGILFIPANKISNSSASMFITLLALACALKTFASIALLIVRLRTEDIYQPESKELIT
jgi:hypothetical protein